MNNFFKFFFASLLALFVFAVLSFLVMLGIFSGLAATETPRTGDKAILVIDLSRQYKEVSSFDPVQAVLNTDDSEQPTLYDVVELIGRARADSSVKGIYLQCGVNANGFASSEELRNALLHFKSSGKFIYAYADIISQSAYHVANVADKIYCNPQGGLEWSGFSMELLFLKGTLEKLDITPQIFYAGKYKSATEPFREYKMSEPSREQNLELLQDLYSHFLLKTAEQRGIDTAALHQYATGQQVNFAADALRLKLVDGLRYDDEVKNELKNLVDVDRFDKLNFVGIEKYAQIITPSTRGRDRIGVIFAEGDIIDGKGDRTQIASVNYRNLIRKARLDKQTKAIVLRINSGGGSALASENILRELILARKEKPVIISFGDVSASGGYYLSCNADSIFVQPNTITGSIGVFAMIPNMEKFFNNKVGVTFDRVGTGGEDLSVFKPLSPLKARLIQASVDSTYFTFKSRVAEGRNLSMDYVDSIAQGRIWSGSQAVQLGLADRIGGIQDAIQAAAALADLDEYRIRQYPGKQTLYDYFFNQGTESIKQSLLQQEMGDENFRIFESVQKLQHWLKTPQARLPFDFRIN